MMQTLATYAIAGLLVFLAGFGTGQKLERNAFETYKAKQEAAAYKQQVQAVTLFEFQRRDNQEVTNEIKADLLNVDAKYLAIRERLRQRTASSGSMPKNGPTACGSDDPTGDYRLLEILRAAEVQAGRLVACQSVIKNTYRIFK